MKGDAYERITARIIEQLEAGTVPWRRPWLGGEAGHPRNLVTGRRYRGVNAFVLACSPFDPPLWLTYRQSQRLGGHVRSGEKSTPIVFWRWVERDDPESGETRRFALLRQYCAFNVEQCDLPAETLPDALVAPRSEFDPLSACEAIVEGMPNPPSIRFGGGAALYRPATDEVRVPKPELFANREAFYSTLFHELAHATGHPSRLNRPGVADLAPFGTPDYSREELVAEMTATFLCGEAGIDNAVIADAAAYIGGWLSRLRNDKRLVVHAAAAAQKAADFVLDRRFDSEAEHDERSQLAAKS